MIALELLGGMMRIWLKYCNIILCVIAAIFGIFVFPHNKITQEVLDLFPNNAQREIIDVYREFSSSRYVLVVSKGFDENSKNTLESFLQRAQSLPNVATTFTHTKIPQALQDFITTHYIAFAYPRTNPPQVAYTPTYITTHITQGVQTLLQTNNAQDTNHNNTHITQDSATQEGSFNPYDPLDLFYLPPQEQQAFIAKDYGFLGIVELRSIESNAIQRTITDFESLAKDFPTIRYFSQNFMDSINLSLTLKETGFLLTFSSIVFILLYFVIIRIPMLTLNSIATLAFANIVAMFVVANVYPHVTIMALTFGMGISNIAIDYMMHHNFFGLYATKHRTFNYPVFYGYLTTIIGFATCLFIPFPLLAQLSLYAIVSLSISYGMFAFVYPRIGFKNPRFFPTLAKWRTLKIPVLWFFMLCAINTGIIATHLHTDFDLSKLGYYNKDLEIERDFFANAYDQDTSHILLSHQNTQGLIALANTLQNALDSNNYNTIIPLSLFPDTKRLKTQETFLQSPTIQQNIATLQRVLPSIRTSILAHSSPDTHQAISALFDDMTKAYNFNKLQDLYNLTPAMLDEMGFRIITHNGLLYYLANIHTQNLAFIQEFAKDTQIQNLGNIQTQSLQTLLSHITDSLYVPMFVVLGIALCAMLITIAISAKGAFLECAIFVLFPLSSALCVISLHTPLNILHLFGLLILVVVSVDYGIYATKEGLNLRTMHAIFFSAITTGVSFGILMLGNTKAIVSFGEVLFVGMMCILALLFLLKKKP